MKRTEKKSIAALVLTLVFVAAAEPAAAGDECLKQGEFAVALAKRVRFDAASELEAVENLAGIGIKPADGWKPAVFLDETAFDEVDRAVILAFAEGKLGKGSPSAARAVLAGHTMSGNCRDLYLGAAPHPVTPLESNVSLQAEAAQQRRPPVSMAAAKPHPEEKERPGIEEPKPGKKPHPYSPSEPWDGPTRPGPGAD